MGRIWCGLFTFAAVALASAPGRADTLSAGKVQAVTPKPDFVPAGDSPAGVVSNGNGWLVGYYEDFNLSQGQGFLAVRVNEAGELLDQPALLIAAPDTLLGWALSTRGGQYHAAWAAYDEDRFEADLTLRTIGSDGKLGDPLVVGTVPASSGNPVPMALASGASAELVIWCEREYDDTGVCEWAKVVDETVVTGSIDLPLYASGVTVSASGSGNSWLVGLNTAANDVYAFRIGTEGSALDTTPFAIAATNTQELGPGIAPAADGWALIWNEYPYFERAGTVSEAGVLSVLKGDLGLDQGYATTLQPMPGGYALFGYKPPWTTYLRFLDAKLAPKTDWKALDASRGFGGAAWGKDSMLAQLYFIEPGTGRYVTTLASRFDATGALLDAEPFPVALQPVDQSHSLVARGSDSWLTVWQEWRTDQNEQWIRSQPLDGAGAPLADSPHMAVFEKGHSLYAAALAASPCGYLLASVDYATYRLGATRLDPGGTPLDSTSIELGKLSFGSMEVDAAFDGQQWVLAWSVPETDFYPYGSPQKGTASILRLGLDGTLVDASPIAVSAPNAARLTSVHVQHDAQGYVVSWHPLDGGVAMARVSSAGVVSPDPPQLLLKAEQPTVSHQLDYREGKGWLFWVQNDYIRDLGFENLLTGAPTQHLSTSWDVGLVTLRDRALAAYVPYNDDWAVSLQLQGADGPLAPALDLHPGTRPFNPHLAAQSGEKALMTYETPERFGNGPLSWRIKAVPLQRKISGVVDPADTMDLLKHCGAPVDAGSGGEGGEAGAGAIAGGVSGAGGDAAESPGASGTTATGGDPGSEEPAGAGGSKAGSPSAGGKTSSAGTTSQAGTASLGGAVDEGEGSAASRNARGCGCRAAGSASSSGSPWLLALVAAKILRRKRPARAARQPASR